VKEYLEARNGFIPEKEALLIAEQVLDGLGAVHEEKVVHRDIDPNNVYLADDGTGVLLDFGGRGHGGGRAHAEHVGRSQARLRAPRAVPQSR
jgi:serine/threonine protein kinase